MSTSVIVIPPSSSNFPDASAARKRRREILTSQRQALELTTASSPRPLNYDGVLKKKPRRVSDLSEVDNNTKSIFSCGPDTKIFTSSTNAKKKNPVKKKPQMKYDPDVPMSKEEAAAWRREQRRKRNRESAALSRQRQRDRIGDLEVEVEQWKTKVKTIMERIKILEDDTGIDSRSLVLEPAQQDNRLDQSLEFRFMVTSDSNQSKFVSPPSSPSPTHSPLHDDVKVSPITSSCAKTVVDAVVDQVLMGIESYEQEFSDNMISRHATSWIIHLQLHISNQLKAVRTCHKDSSLELSKSSHKMHNLKLTAYGHGQICSNEKLSFQSPFHWW